MVYCTVCMMELPLVTCLYIPAIQEYWGKKKLKSNGKFESHFWLKWALEWIDVKIKLNCSFFLLINRVSFLSTITQIVVISHVPQTEFRAPNSLKPHFLLFKVGVFWVHKTAFNRGQKRHILWVRYRIFCGSITKYSGSQNLHF